MSNRILVLSACGSLLLASLACGLGGIAPSEADTLPVSEAEQGSEEPAPAPPVPTEEPVVVEPPYEGPVSEGALARIGRGIVTDMALSPDGQFLALSTSIGVYLYSTDTLTEAWYFPADELMLQAVFSQDGSRLAALSSARIYLLDAASGELAGEPIINSDQDARAAFSPDGKILAATRGSAIKLWDVATGEEVAELVGHTNEVASLAWTPDGSQMVSGSTDKARKNGELIVWDVASGEALRQFGEEHTRLVHTVVFSPDGSKLLTDAAKEAIIWDFGSGTAEATIESSNIEGAAWSPDGTLIAFGSFSDGRTWVYDAASVTESYQVEDQLIKILSVAFSPDSSLLYTLDSGGTVFERDARTGQMQRSIEGFTSRYEEIVWSPDGETLWAGTSGSRVIHWDVQTPDILDVYGDFGSSGLAGGTVQALAYSPDDALIAVGDLNGRIHLLDPAAGMVMTVFGDSDTGHKNAVKALAWSPDGTRIVSSSLDQTVVIWDVEAQTPLVKFDGFTDKTPSDVAFSPDGSTVVVTSWDGGVYVLDPASGTVRSQWNPDLGSLDDLDWHPTQPTQFVTACSDESVVIWDYTTAEQVLAMEDSGFVYFPTVAAFSPDGTRVAAGDSLGNVALWDAATGALIAEYDEPHADSVSAVAFSPDSATFATASHEGTILIWPVN